jgi:hypothetical protein
MGSKGGVRRRTSAKERKRIIKGRNGGEVEKRGEEKVENRRGKKGTFVKTIEKYKNELKRREILKVP